MDGIRLRLVGQDISKSLKLAGDRPGTSPDHVRLIRFVNGTSGHVSVYHRTELGHLLHQYLATLFGHKAADLLHRGIALCFQGRCCFVIYAEKPGHHDHGQRLCDLRHPLDAARGQVLLNSRIDELTKLALPC